MGWSAGGRQIMSRVVLAVLCLGSIPALAGAAPLAHLDPEVGTPYRLQVVLHIAQHRQFTDVFRGQVERELHDTLQAALGDLAEVEVVHTHPHLAKIEAEGLQQGLDGWNDVTGVKTHIVLIDFTDDQYEIQARQHDGLTGLLSPVVRRLRIDDRQLVARTAALLVDRDFGAVGTVTKRIDPQTMEVTLKASRLKGDLGHWVKKGEIFAIAAIAIPPGKPAKGFRVEWALLQVSEEPQSGVCTCKLFHRLQNPMPETGAIRGYRCLKLGTVRGPLRLRLVDDTPAKTPLNGIQIGVSRYDFREGAELERHSTNSDGFVQTEKDYPGVAFVRVLSGSRARIRIPVPILDDRIVECRMANDAKAETFASLEVRKERWMRHLYERIQVLSDLADDLKDLETKSLLAAARDKAVPSLKDLETEMDRLKDEQTELEKSARELGAAGRLDLHEGEQLLHTLQLQREKLGTHVTDLQSALAEQNNPRKQGLQNLLNQATLLEDQAEYGQALAKYDEVFTKYADLLAKSDPTKTEKLKAHAADLKKAWEPKNDAHRQARGFIYEKWPTFKTSKEMNEHFQEAQAAFQACMAANDRLAPKKLYKETVAHINDVEKELAQLRDAEDEDSQKKTETIAKVAEELKKLLQDVAAYLQPPKAK
jgi:hypothetical protein